MSRNDCKFMIDGSYNCNEHFSTPCPVGKYQDKNICKIAKPKLGSDYKIITSGKCTDDTEWGYIPCQKWSKGTSSDDGGYCEDGASNAKCNEGLLSLGYGKSYSGMGSGTAPGCIIDQDSHKYNKKANINPRNRYVESFSQYYGWKNVCNSRYNCVCMKTSPGGTRKGAD